MILPCPPGEQYDAVTLYYRVSSKCPPSIIIDILSDAPGVIAVSVEEDGIYASIVSGYESSVDSMLVAHGCPAVLECIVPASDESRQ